MCFKVCKKVISLGTAQKNQTKTMVQPTKYYPVILKYIQSILKDRSSCVL